MSKILKNTKLTNNFSLYEFIEGKALPQLAIEMNWLHLLNTTTQERDVIVNNIKTHATELQKIRDLINTTFSSRVKNIGITISSGYRCPAWELHRGRSGDSQHVFGHASDFIITNVSDNKLYDEIMEFIYDYYDSTKWMGGLARLYNQTQSKKWRFIHLDHRTPNQTHINRGYGARWDY